MPASRLEAELSRTHEPDNFLTNVTSRSLPTSASAGSLGAPGVGASQLDTDPLSTDLSFLLGEESNSPPPATSSPAKQAPPAPPGATVCECSSHHCTRPLISSVSLSVSLSLSLSQFRVVVVFFFGLLQLLHYHYNFSISFLFFSDDVCYCCCPLCCHGLQFMCWTPSKWQLCC